MVDQYVIPHEFKLVYQVDFKDVYLNERSKTILIIWNSNSAYLSPETYREDVLHNIELFKENGAVYWVSDYRQNKFKITDDLQYWYVNEIAEKLEDLGLRKTAVIIDADLSMLGSLEEISARLLKERGVHKIPHRFFPTIDEAFKWVNR